MAITCKDILLFSKECIARDDEVGYRNAISRAYYAAYHCVSPAMMHAPHDSHQGLINYLKQSDSPSREGKGKNKLIALAYALQNMKDMRVVADYYLSSDAMNKTTAKSCIQMSENVIGKILTIETEITK